MAISKDFFTSSYRTHVLNDFSVVTKAMFYGLKKSNDEYTLEDKLPVQINPDTLSYNRRSKVISNEGIISSIFKTGQGHDLASLEVELYYNIYDEYNVRTNYGMTGAIDNNVSLFNDEFTSLPKLQSYVNQEDMFVLFRWGDIQFFGQIESVDCTYNAFSMWGNPLECRAPVRIKEVPINGKSNTTDISLVCFGSVDIVNEIENYELNEKIVNSAAIDLMDISSEVSGIVLNAIQGALR